MGTAETPEHAFREAVQGDSFRLAMNAARELDLDLRQSLDLVLIAPPELYERFTVRWIRRLMDERPLTLLEIRWCVERFEDHREKGEPESRDALARFVSKASTGAG